MSTDPLVGGQAAAKRHSRRRVRRPHEDAIPPRVGWQFLAVVLVLGALVMGAGIWRVQTVFESNDLRMETRRLQEIAAERRDRARVLESRVSHLQGSEILREAAARDFGMAVPEPLEVETLEVASEVRERWRRAGEQTRQHAGGEEDMAGFEGSQ